jgi:hypothetical protein
MAMGEEARIAPGKEGRRCYEGNDIQREMAPIIRLQQSVGVGK